MGRTQNGLPGVYNATALTLTNEEGAAPALDIKGQLIMSPLPASGGMALTTQSSGNVAAAVATATLAGVAAKTTYISGFAVTGSGATAGSVVSITITGLLGGTATYTLAVVAGATLGNTPLILQFVPAMPASAVNTSIVVSCPSLGAGNTNNAVVATGYTL